jgi:signal transduction histidine kinase
VTIELVRERARDDPRITLTMTDDGAGADWSKHGDGLGLVGMRERVDSLGGALHVTTAPGRGFRVVAQFPVPRAA